jgi:hypothetical protein
MITAEEVKERYIIKAERNGTNDNISTDNYRFCLNFNESQNKYITLQLQNRGVDDIRYIQHLLVLDEKIDLKNTKQNKVNFDLPLYKKGKLNYFDFSSARANAKKDSCQDIIDLIEVKTENLNEALFNEHLKPSFKWREALFTINSNQLSIYTDDFSVDSLLLNYYRYPNQIKLKDSDNPESDFDSTTIEWDDKVLDDIITLMVVNFDINEGNQRFQYNTIRLQK